MTDGPNEPVDLREELNQAFDRGRYHERRQWEAVAFALVHLVDTFEDAEPRPTRAAIYQALLRLRDLLPEAEAYYHEPLLTRVREEAHDVLRP